MRSDEVLARDAFTWSTHLIFFGPGRFRRSLSLSDSVALGG